MKDSRCRGKKAVRPESRGKVEAEESVDNEEGFGNSHEIAAVGSQDPYEEREVAQGKDAREESLDEGGE